MKNITRHIDCLKLDILFVVGGNAQENHDIIDSAQPDDVWFHLSNLPSCHVIASMPTDRIITKPELHRILKQGALICIQNSNTSISKTCKNNKSIKTDVEWTLVQNVTKLDIPGKVLAEKVRIISV
jgi:predicted ribosome quality control (RQC) complex YloA/Tae2 family protein